MENDKRISSRANSKEMNNSHGKLQKDQQSWKTYKKLTVVGNDKNINTSKQSLKTTDNK